MPIYEFHCQKCGAESEILVRSSDWEGTPCPKCASRKLVKKLSIFSSSVATQTAPATCPGNGGPSCCGCPAGRPHSH